MRLVIDLHSSQGESRQRGIGRQSRALARALASDSRGHEVWLLLSSSFPGTVGPLREMFRGLVPDDRIVVMDLPGPVAWNHPGSREVREQAERRRESILADLAPDVVHLSSLFEGLSDESVASIPDPGNRWISSVTLHDLMPLIHPGTFITDPSERQWYEGKLAQLRTADLWLAVSESSRREGLDYLGLPGDRVVNISSAADDIFRVGTYSGEDRYWLLCRYGLSKPFIMFTGGDSPQKNIEGLVRAYAALPESLRREYQLAIVCKIQSENRSRLQVLARKLGLDRDDLVFTGYVTDENLVAFYNLCRLFVFPSWHEGFGLPVLEAMGSGAAVIGSNKTSVSEVIGLPDALFDPMDVGDITAKMQQVLADPEFHACLVEHGLRRCRDFSWEKSASRAWDAFESATGMRGTPPMGGVIPPIAAESVKPRQLRPPAMEVGVEYGMNGAHSLIPFLGQGWSNPEAWGVWSDGGSCTLLVEVDPCPDGPVVLILRGHGFVNWRHWNVRLSVSANGRAVGGVAFSFWRRHRSLRIPLEDVGKSGLILLECTISNPASPESLGMGPDQRELGFGLQSLRLDRI